MNNGGVMRIGRGARKEVISAYVHYMWADWCKIMLANMTPANIESWKLASEGRYTHLSEAHRDFCRQWAEQLLNLIEGIPHDPQYRIDEKELEMKLEIIRQQKGRLFI